jgi:endonuclease YncB( thermonuclease family)
VRGVRRSTPRRFLLLVPLAAAMLVPFASAHPDATLARVDHVADGDTLTLTNGRRVRLVQIDTPEVYFHAECYGRQASRIAKRMLPPGTLVRLSPEPATDRVDRYRRLLRYVVRARDGVDVNVRLVPCRRRRAVLLRRQARSVLAAARPSRAPRSRPSSRVVGCVPRDALPT